MRIKRCERETIEISCNRDKFNCKNRSCKMTFLNSNKILIEYFNIFPSQKSIFKS